MENHNRKIKENQNCSEASGKPKEEVCKQVQVSWDDTHSPAETPSNPDDRLWIPVEVDAALHFSPPKLCTCCWKRAKTSLEQELYKAFSAFMPGAIGPFQNVILKPDVSAELEFEPKPLVVRVTLGLRILRDEFDEEKSASIANAVREALGGISDELAQPIDLVEITRVEVKTKTPLWYSEQMRNGFVVSFS